MADELPKPRTVTELRHEVELLAPAERALFDLMPQLPAGGLKVEAAAERLGVPIDEAARLVDVLWARSLIGHAGAPCEGAGYWKTPELWSRR